MKRLRRPLVACCLGALLLAACGGGGDDKDNLGVTISAVPTRSVDALGDFATLTPVPTLAVPAVSPTTAPAATSTPQPPAVAPAQAPAATPTPQPAPPPASAATPVTIVNVTPGVNNTFTYNAGPAGGTASCAPSGSGGPPPQITSGAPPPGGPPPQGAPGNQVFSAGAGGADSLAGLAGFLGVSTAQLQSELSQKGATQASVAARHGKPRDQLKAFLVEQTRKLFATEVSAGRMTQAQATQFLNQFTADIDKVIDGAGGCAGGLPTFQMGPAR